MGKVVVTGPPGSGKTTLVGRAVEALRARGEVLAGFTTTEIRRGGRRTGFTVAGVGGLERRLATAGGPGPRVGRYGVDVAAFESVALLELENGIEIGATLIVDEIGPMEMLSEGFRHLVPQLFAAPRLLATVHARPDPATRSLTCRDDVHVVDLAVHDRDTAVRSILGRLLDAQP